MLTVAHKMKLQHIEQLFERIPISNVFDDKNNNSVCIKYDVTNSEYLDPL